MGACTKMVPPFSAMIKIKNGSTKMKSIMHMCYGWFGFGKPCLNIQSIIYRKCDILHLRYVKLKKKQRTATSICSFCIPGRTERKQEILGRRFGGHTIWRDEIDLEFISLKGNTICMQWKVRVALFFWLRIRKIVLFFCFVLGKNCFDFLF